MGRNNSRAKRELRQEKAAARVAADSLLSNRDLQISRLKRMQATGHDHCAQAEAIKDALHDGHL